MMLTSFQAAKKVCELSEWTITNLKLQKVLYITHLLHLGEKEKPLIGDIFEAWIFGPVIPDLYNKVKVFSDRPIKNIFFSTNFDENSDDIKFIESKYPEIASKTAWDLVVMTHLEGGAWEKYYDPEEKRSCGTIKNEDIIKEYKKFYA